MSSIFFAVSVKYFNGYSKQLIWWGYLHFLLSFIGVENCQFLLKLKNCTKARTHQLVDCFCQVSNDNWQASYTRSISLFPCIWLVHLWQILPTIALNDSDPIVSWIQVLIWFVNWNFEKENWCIGRLSGWRQETAIPVSSLAVDCLKMLQAEILTGISEMGKLIKWSTIQTILCWPLNSKQMLVPYLLGVPKKCPLKRCMCFNPTNGTIETISECKSFNIRKFRLNRWLQGLSPPSPFSTGRTPPYWRWSSAWPTSSLSRTVPIGVNKPILNQFWFCWRMTLWPLIASQLVYQALKIPMQWIYK